MLRTSLLNHLRRGKPIYTPSGILSVSFSTSNSKSYVAPKPHLKLDPTYEVLFKDIEISLKNAGLNPPIHRELQVVSETQEAFSQELPIDEWTPMEISLEPTLEEGFAFEDRYQRKSPAALFGSNQISMVVLPEELQNAINVLISAETKSTLRSDSIRLFKTTTEANPEGEWDTDYDTTYSSSKKAARHAVRDGMAFATVALPPHYSVITSVLHHIKSRLEPDWEVNRIIDWGAGTGSGLWAASYAFQNKDPQDSPPTLGNSSIKSYLGIDKREGLVSIGKRLVAHTPKGGLNIEWKKSFRQADKGLREEAHKTIALSAFALTSLPNPMAQKTLVQDMWESGAHTIVLIDHNTTKGYQAVAQAREYILRLGREEIEDPENAQSDLLGSHVLAPCPHDHACPLLRSGGSSLTCGFTQRLQRPGFVRSTKQSGVGHEDIEYSYVVIRRGPRPNRVNSEVGRVGGVGKRAIEEHKFANAPIRELDVEDENEIPTELGLRAPTPEEEISTEDVIEPSEIDAQLRKEAHHWPRLVFRPLKKSGHIILDSCTHEGKIMRVTIPKSQGKQPFYDARKSSWGDLFPHEPKNKPIERTFSKSDIGKRGDSFDKRAGKSYGSIAHGIREKRKQSRRDYANTRGEKVWED